jgi:large subunit ribosomal protein L33
MAADTIKIIMRSSASDFFYTTTKNKRNKKEKLVLKRYDPVVRKHVEFNEEKMR